MTADALWCVAPNEVAVRSAQTGQGVSVRTRFSAISRGTERLVFEGRVPADQTLIMRAPYQEGSFPFPVKYGYAAVGDVESGVLSGQTVFALFPHQTRFSLPEAELLPVPEHVPPERAILAANMETALNVVWDSGAGPGDSITIVGAGVVGALTGFLAARLPGAEVTLVDPVPSRADLANLLGCRFAHPDEVSGESDVVVHTSATPDGLKRAIACAGPEAVIVEASWYGAGDVAVPLGGAFHSRRLRLVSSQVGALPPVRRLRWTHRRRLAKALELLDAPELDALISGETSFEQMPERYAEILASEDTLCHRIRY